jgi:hypothetical protein
LASVAGVSDRAADQRPAPSRRSVAGVRLRSAAPRARHVRRAVSDLLDPDAWRLPRDGVRLLPADTVDVRGGGCGCVRLHPPLTMAAKRRRPAGRGRTRSLAAAAGTATIALVVAEVLHIWRRGEAPTPAHPRDVLRGGGIAARETVQVVHAGYRAGSANEMAVLNLFVAFGATFGAARAVTHSIRRGMGPWRNVKVGRRHIHHFVPGIVLALISGGLSIALPHEQLDHWLALPFGAGAALIADETALLIELNDVYWSDKGVLSIDVSLGTLTTLAGLTLLVRLVRRGEATLLPA